MATLGSFRLKPPPKRGQGWVAAASACREVVVLVQVDATTASWKVDSMKPDASHYNWIKESIKHLCIVALVLFSSSLSSLAQDQDTPTWELYSGFQFTSYQAQQLQPVTNFLASVTGLPSSAIGTRQNLIGWNFSAQQNMNSWFGGIIDFSGGYGSKRVTLSQPGGSSSTFTFHPALYTMGGGPQFTFRAGSRTQPFVRMICAAAYANFNPNGAAANTLAAHVGPSTSDTYLALIFGGGIDYRLKSYASFRVAGDYVHTFLFSDSESTFRMTAGINFRILHR